MNKKEFEKIIETDDFSYVESSELDYLFVCNLDLNITLNLVKDEDWGYQEQTYFDKPKESRFCTLNYYYNGVLIISKCCLFGYVAYKPIYLPVPEWFNKNGDLAKPEDELIFHFDKSKIYFLNKLLGNSVDIRFLMSHLEYKENVKIN